VIKKAITNKNYEDYMTVLSSIWLRIKRNLFLYLEEKLDSAEKTLYNERTTVEHVFGRLLVAMQRSEKDEFEGRMILVRRSSKVIAHLMFGILAKLI